MSVFKRFLLKFFPKKHVDRTLFKKKWQFQRRKIFCFCCLQWNINKFKFGKLNLLITKFKPRTLKVCLIGILEMSIFKVSFRVSIEQGLIFASYQLYFLFLSQQWQNTKSIWSKAFFTALIWARYMANNKTSLFR